MKNHHIKSLTEEELRQWFEKLAALEADGFSTFGLYRNAKDEIELRKAAQLSHQHSPVENTEVDQ